MSKGAEVLDWVKSHIPDSPACQRLRKRSDHSLVAIQYIDFDDANMSVKLIGRDSGLVPLPPNEYAVLKILSVNTGRFVSTLDLFALVWGDEDSIDYAGIGYQFKGG